MRQIGVMGSIAIDNIFNTQSVPIKGERVFGELLGRHIGGIGANQAIEAARYVDTVHMLGFVGNDASGQEIKTYLNSRNVKTDLLKVDQKEATGQTYMHLVNEKSDYFSIVVPGANYSTEFTAIQNELEKIRNGVLCLSLEINLDAAKQALILAKQYNIYTYLCASPAESCCKELLEEANALILNEREAQILLGVSGNSVKEIAQCLYELKTAHELILLSLGKYGAILKENNRVYYSPILDVEVLDTIGAGDALTGAFIAARELGYSPYKALSYSCIAGSLAVSVVGAQTSRHTPEIVEQYYQKYFEGKERLLI